MLSNMTEGQPTISLNAFFRVFPIVSLKLFKYAMKTIEHYCDLIRDQVQQLQNELMKENAKVKKLTDQRSYILVMLLSMDNRKGVWKSAAKNLKIGFVDVTTRLQLRKTQMTEIWKRLQSELERAQLLVDVRPVNNSFECLLILQREGKLTDFMLMVDGKAIEVHKNVLAVKSKFFGKLFKEHSEKSEYTIEGTTFEAVKEMVEYVYLDESANFGDHLNELYELSVRFQIDALKENCVDFLKSKLTIETSAELFISSTKCKDENFTKNVTVYVQQNDGEEKLASSTAVSNLVQKDVKLLTEICEAFCRLTI
ncbi:Protein roadkill-like protein [Aphelenchoides besseyi]|nr:Protein roadkill-like protein [Aphelenchoides besseyi]